MQITPFVFFFFSFEPTYHSLLELLFIYFSLLPLPPPPPPLAGWTGLSWAGLGLMAVEVVALASAE